MKWEEMEKGNKIDYLLFQTEEMKQDNSNEVVIQRRQYCCEQNSQMNFHF